MLSFALAGTIMRNVLVIKFFLGSFIVALLAGAALAGLSPFPALVVVALLAFVFSLFLSNHLVKSPSALSGKTRDLPDDHGAAGPSKDLPAAATGAEKEPDLMNSSPNRREGGGEDTCTEINESKRLVTLGRLVAGVAHEINNPLGGILVYSNLLLEDTEPDDLRYSNIRKIVRETNRCKNIVKGLLDFSRQSPPRLEELSVNNLVTEALNNINLENVFRNIQIVKQFDQNIPLMLGDDSQLQEVFENIIRNAAEVMDGSGTLTITSRFNNGRSGKQMVEILFTDTGGGISDEDLNSIFEPFYTTKRKGQGTGLGLAVSYSIIERHGGTITVHHSEEGGAVFSVKLPVKEVYS